MDQGIRNKLRNVVTQCRKLLEEAVAQVLQGQFGIYASGKRDEVYVEDEARMAHLRDEDRAYRKDILGHFEHIKAFGSKPKDALDQLVREIAFTHLNRLCAYKMMETRGLIREAVSRELRSQGFIFYLADHPEDEQRSNTGQQDVAYRHFLDWLGDTLSEEIGVLFNPNDPANRLYPPQRVLDDVLVLINDKELAGIWSEDETIGWVYQYFTPKELRDQARKESAAPQNSYELAFRNQFFTPRYVVEFLTDNTLGRMWYEMRRGNTALTDQCRYMVRRPNEHFLEKGQTAPQDGEESTNDLSQEELLKQPVYIAYRPKKDPRDLKILDPACGSGHFLLYCFDLLQAIYEEAYHDPDLGPVLRKDYSTLEDLQRAVPGLILSHNLHGIDIDIRATQIAALALWLRCQRAYQEIGLKRDRPKITRSNIICAEPMPGEKDMLKEFVAELQPRVLGQLVEVVFEKMKLAGEAGSLLKIEEELRDTIAEAKQQWLQAPQQEQLALFNSEQMKLEQQPLFELSGITDEAFWTDAEAKVLASLQGYAQTSASSNTFQRQLFANDIVHGFAFIDVCQKRFDITLMNPPFGEATQKTFKTFRHTFPYWNDNLLCAFIERAWQFSLDDGKIGVIYDRTALVKSTYEDFRRSHLIPDHRLVSMVDLGWGILDANVEVTTSVLSRSASLSRGTFYDARAIPLESKEDFILNTISRLSVGELSDGVFAVDPASFGKLPNGVIGYDFPSFLRRAFTEAPSLADAGYRAYTGHQLKAETHFRLWWKVSYSKPPRFMSRMFNGSAYSPYSTSLRDCAIAQCGLDEIPKDSSTVLRNKERHYLPGVCFGKRGEFFCTHVLPPDHIFTVEGQSIPISDKEASLEILGLLNTPLARMSLNKFCGQHKYSGYVNLFPFIMFPDRARIREAVAKVLEIHAKTRSLDETQPLFSSPLYTSSLSTYAERLCRILKSATEATRECEMLCHNAVLTSYKVPVDEQQRIEEFLYSQPLPENVIEDADITSGCKCFAAHSITSHAFGFMLGRWNVFVAKCAQQQPEVVDPFAASPHYPSAMLRGPDGFPLTDTPEGYPLRIHWDGILVDDPDHPDDIIRRIRDVLELIWEDHADAIEKEVCEILGVKDLRDYFRKPGNGGFWDNHVKSYSKSRRKAPIYWLLQSSKKNYALWLYYHRLDKDMLFKALLHYVEPKIRLEESRLETLRSQQVEVGTSGSGAKKLAKDIDRQEALISELRDFEDKLRRVANLHLDTDLNDGVVLNIAPLRELVPWKEAKTYWDELLAGTYAWSSIGKQLREKGIVHGS